ncbi:type VI secretion system tube protein Hcp [Maioricimonas sp. JC845]|uniref:Hcp family type VI secretion system effector n=1 Tax=Maioricimonas sp. JC845 TaxID=3232138 RepID=UPI003457891A
MAGFIWFKDSPIVGEATQGSMKDGPEYYHGWIELNSVTETVTRAIETGRSGTARARAGTVLEEIEIEKEMDRTTVPLIQACSGGTAFPEVWIHLVTSIAEEVGAGEALHPYLEMRMFAVKVTSYSMNGSGLDDGSIPTETISLNFDKIVWKYWPIGPIPEDLGVPANKVWPAVEAGWDILRQAPFAG